MDSTIPLGSTRSGDIFVKTELHRDDLNEELVSGSLAYGATRTDLPGLGSNSRHVVLPGISIGKGFGNLPDSLAWLRPFAIAGAIADEIPARRSPYVAAALPAARDFVDAQAQNVATLHWGFALELSTACSSGPVDSSRESCRPRSRCTSSCPWSSFSSTRRTMARPAVR